MTRSELGWDIELYSDEGCLYAQLKLGQGFQLCRVPVYGSSELNPYQSLRVVKLSEGYCVVVEKLYGGGCCHSKTFRKPKHSTPFQLPQEDEESKHPMPSSNQALAAKYANDLRAKAKDGFFDGMPLAELQDIDESTIEDPLAIGRALMFALYVEDFWVIDYRFLFRYTIARLVRKYIWRYALLNPHASVSELKEFLKEIMKMAKSRNEIIAVNTGLLLELKLLCIMLETNKKWPQTLTEYGTDLDKCFTAKNSRHLPRNLSHLYKRAKTFNKNDSLIARALLIDRLYSTNPQHALQFLKKVLRDNQPWKTRYLALLYLDWAIHRGLLDTEQLSPIRPVLAELIELGDSKVNEKLATILVKLKKVPLFEELLESLKGRMKGKIFKFIECLQPWMLSPERNVRNLEMSSSPDSFSERNDNTSIMHIQPWFLPLIESYKFKPFNKIDKEGRLSQKIEREGYGEISRTELHMLRERVKPRIDSNNLAMWAEIDKLEALSSLISKHRKLLETAFDHMGGYSGNVLESAAKEVLNSSLRELKLSDEQWNRVLEPFVDEDGLDYIGFLDSYKTRATTASLHPQPS